MGPELSGRGVEQSFGVSLNRGERRAEFVRDVGDEIAARFFDALSLGEITKHGDDAPVGQGGCGYVEGPAGNDGGGARGLDLFCGGRGLDGGEEVRIPNRLNHGRIEASSLRDKAVHGLIGPLHQAIGADGDDGVLHAIEQSLELALAGADGGKATLDLSGGFVDSGGHPANFVDGMILETGPQIAALDAGGHVDDAFEATGGPDGSQGRDDQRDQKGQSGSPEHTAADLGLNRFDVGKWVGEAHGATRNGGGHVEKRDPQRRAATFVGARLTGEGGGELRASGVVLHAGGIGFRVGEHFAGGVDDGGAGARRLTFLSSDFSERMGAVDFDAVREQQSLLGEVALDFRAKRAFPCAAQHDVQNAGRGADHDQKDGQQLEENPVLHHLLIWELQNGSRRRGRF